MGSWIGRNPWVAVGAVLAMQPAWGQSAATSGCSAPRSCIEALHDGLVALSQDPDASATTLRFQRLRPLISATHDLPYIAEFTVRRQWPEFSAQEQAAFVDAFERLSVMSYASRFGRLETNPFEILEVNELSEERVEVAAAITRAEAPDVPMEYLLQRGEAGWRIINIIADGVSDLALKRAEYQRVLREGSAADLVQYLEGQIAELEAR